MRARRSPFLILIGLVLIIVQIAAIYLTRTDFLGGIIFVPFLGILFGVLFCSPGAIGAILIGKGLGLSLPTITRKRTASLVIALFLIAVLFVAWINWH